MSTDFNASPLVVVLFSTLLDDDVVVGKHTLHWKQLSIEPTETERALIYACTNQKLLVDEDVRGGGTHFNLGLYLEHAYGRDVEWNSVETELRADAGFVEKHEFTRKLYAADDTFDRGLLGDVCDTSDGRLLVKAPVIKECAEDGQGPDFFSFVDGWRQKIDHSTGDIFEHNPEMRQRILELDRDVGDDCLHNDHYDDKDRDET
jgi:hypothetical protein